MAQLAGFLEELGFTVVVSAPLVRADQRRSEGGVDEVCLPVKVFLGHVWP